MYNDDESVNTEAIAELEKKLSHKLGLYGPKDNGYGGSPISSDFARSYPYNDTPAYQCFWFAGRRAKEYIEKFNLHDDRPSGSSALEGSKHINCEIDEFKKNPVANAYIFWDLGTPYGHVAYVEAVDKDGSLWISECNGGRGWSGVINKSPGGTKFTPENNYSYGSCKCLGFFVLDRVSS